MSRPTSVLDSYKKQATALQTYLGASGVTLKRTNALEAIARVHGFKNFHQLSDQAPVSLKRIGVKDVTKAIRRGAERYDYEIYGEVVRAVDSEFGIFIAEKDRKGHVTASVLGSRNEQKVYREGDAINNLCPPEILLELTPTDDVSCLLWREGAWVFALRRQLIDTSEDLIPWMLHHGRQPVGDYQPALAARGGVKTNDWYVCDWETVRLVQVGSEWSRCCAELGLNGETPLAGHEHLARDPGQHEGHWVEMGVAPFRVWAFVRKDGGYICWTANPWQYSGSALVGDDFEAHGRRHGMSDDIALAQPVLENFVRPIAHLGTAAWAQLQTALKDGHFDPA